MSLYYYKTDVGNIGDDINAWLWPQLIKNLDDPNLYYIGAGSILTSQLNHIVPTTESIQKIFLGTGVKSIDSLPTIDSSWDLSFLRGPISSLFLTNKPDNYITDGVYCLRLLEGFKHIKTTPKKYKIAFMPYLRDSELIGWKKLCKACNIHYISPHPEKGVEHVLNEIAASELVISEAMHGAILADIFRIPWVPVRFTAHLFERGSVNETKWQDWARSIDIDMQHEILYGINYKIGLHPKILKGYILLNKRKIEKEIERALKGLKDGSRAYLSSDATIAGIDEKLNHKIAVYNKIT